MRPRRTPRPPAGGDARARRREKILIVDDEIDILNLLEYNLRRQGYRVFTAKDAESSLPLARRHNPDLIVLDIMLPNMDGLELCRLLRQETQAPVIFLTAKKNELDRVLGFKLGGDDYVIKPFSLREFLARVEAILRRSTAGVARPGDATLRIGSVEIDRERREVRVRGRPQTLPPKEFDLLLQLAQADGKVLSRDQLLDRVWGHGPGAEIDTRTVDQHVARLRRKLQSERARLVTVTNAGYRLKTD